MKKKYLAVILLLIICSIAKVNALTIDNCEVLASYKLYSSLDEENYICKGKEYGSSTDAIYYSGSGSKIILNNFNAYYFTNWEEYDVTLDINGDNNIITEAVNVTRHNSNILVNSDNNNNSMNSAINSSSASMFCILVKTFLFS